MRLWLGPEENESWNAEPLIQFSVGALFLGAVPYAVWYAAAVPDEDLNGPLLAVFSVVGLFLCLSAVRRYVDLPRDRDARSLDPVVGVVVGVAALAFAALSLLWSVFSARPRLVYVLPTVLGFGWIGALATYAGLRYGRASHRRSRSEKD